MIFYRETISFRRMFISLHVRRITYNEDIINEVRINNLHLSSPSSSILTMMLKDECMSLKGALEKADKSDSIEGVNDVLEKLASLPMTDALIKETKLGKDVKEIKAKYATSAPEVSKKATEVLKAWTKIAKAALSSTSISSSSPLRAHTSSSSASPNPASLSLTTTFFGQETEESKAGGGSSSSSFQTSSSSASSSSSSLSSSSSSTSLITQKSKKKSKTARAIEKLNEEQCIELEGLDAARKKVS